MVRRTAFGPPELPPQSAAPTQIAAKVPVGQLLPSVTVLLVPNEVAAQSLRLWPLANDTSLFPASRLAALAGKAKGLSPVVGQSEGLVKGAPEPALSLGLVASAVLTPPGPLTARLRPASRLPSYVVR